MSRAAMNLVWSIGRDKAITTSYRLILACLADHHNGRSGQCNPTYDTIAKEVGLASATVKQYMAEMKELDLIDWKTGGNRSNQYWFPSLQKANVSSGTPDYRNCSVSSGEADNTVVDENDPIVGNSRPLSSGTPDANIKEQGPSRYRDSQDSIVESFTTVGEFAEKGRVTSTESLRAQGDDPTSVKPWHQGNEYADPFLTAETQSDCLPGAEFCSNDPQELSDPMSDADWKAYHSAVGVWHQEDP